MISQFFCNWLVEHRQKGHADPVKHNREADSFGRQDFTNQNPWDRAKTARVAKNKGDHCKARNLFMVLEKEKVYVVPIVFHADSYKYVNEGD